jgi:hypothetical protein
MKLLQFTGDYCLSMVKITVDISTVHCWVIKLRGSGRNMDLNDRPWWGRCQSNSRFEQAKLQQIYSRKSTKINSETFVKTLKRLKE